MGKKQSASNIVDDLEGDELLDDEIQEPVDVVDGEAIEVDPDLEEEAEGEDGSAEKSLKKLTAALELSDDPVRLYLKEIGRVELLGTDQELWLAARMEAENHLER